MDILTIATREGNKAHDSNEGNEAKAEAYYTTYTATLQRGRMGEEVLAAELVSRNGKAGSYYVQS